MDSESAIAAARNAYENLTDAQKQNVSNLSVLEAAEERFTLLQNLGDITGDNEVNVLDSLSILQQSVGKISLNEEQTLHADVNGDGNINVLDALMILHLTVGKITVFPVTQRPNV